MAFYFLLNPAQFYFFILFCNELHVVFHVQAYYLIA